MEQDALTLLNGLISKQKLLLEAFHTCFPEADDLLLSVPRSGVITCDNVLWEFQKHGSGIIFREVLTGIEIDVDSHVEIQDAVDGWRLSTYFQSLNLDFVNHFNRTYDTDDEGVRELLSDLILAGILEPFSDSHKLLRIKK
jgi:hypothetical protein